MSHRLTNLGVVLLSFVALTLYAGQARAIPTPTASVSVGGQTIDLSDAITFNPATGRYALDATGVPTPVGVIDLFGDFDTDPFLSFVIVVTNTIDNPSDFGISLATPFVPISGPNTVTSSLSGGLTDNDLNGVSMTPTPGATILIGNVLDAGANPTNMGVDIGPGSTSVGLYGPYTGGPIAGPVGTWLYLQANVGFTLSAHDSVSLDGRLEIVEGAPPTPGVPEPATSALGVIAAGALSGSVLRRRVGQAVVL